MLFQIPHLRNPFT